MSEEDQNLETVMGLIMNGGNAKSSAFEAIHAAKAGDFEKADEKLKESDHFLTEAHNVQTGMLTAEAQGDHLMNAITFRDLAGEMVDLYKQLSEKEA